MGSYATGVVTNSLLAGQKLNMLVLSRNENQRIRIGENIWLLVVKIQGNKVRLGIEADASIPIVREELLRNTRPMPTEPQVEVKAHN